MSRWRSPYIRMLRKTLNIQWSSYTSNEVLYGKLPAVADKIVANRLQLAGHCHRHPERPEGLTMGAAARTQRQRASTDNVCGHLEEGYRGKERQ